MVIDFFKIDLIWGCGRLYCIELTISPINFSNGLDIGAISERLNAPMIFIISFKFASLLFLRSSFTYYDMQVEMILKSWTFSLIFSVKSIADCFLLVTFVLFFPFESSMFLLRFITLIVCFDFFAFLGSMTAIFCCILLNFEAEKLVCAKCIDAAAELNASFLKTTGDSL